MHPEMPSEQLPGLIIRSQSGFFTVQTDRGVLTCHLRGRLKQGKHTGDIAAVGDRVRVTCQSEGSGSIESIEPRSHSLVRLDPRPQGLYQQVILANPDQAVFVFACAQPAPHMRMLDRFLVIAGRQGLPALIVANKIDLVGRRQAEETFGFYPTIGYTVIYACAKSGEGVEELHGRLKCKISALAGPSGVGKSSLLNAIQPGLGLAVREISEAFQKGRHTTTVRQLFPWNRAATWRTRQGCARWRCGIPSRRNWTVISPNWPRWWRSASSATATIRPNRVVRCGRPWQPERCARSGMIRICG